MAPTTSPIARASRLGTAGPRVWAASAYGQAVIAVSLLGLAVRGLFLGYSPLWSDEAFMGVLMRRSLADMITVVHNDNHPPLQYLLVRAATLLGDSPVALRLPSVLCGAAAVPVAIALGRRAGGDRAGIAAGGVVAVMPLLVLWSRDARMYALATTMVLAIALALWRALEQPSWGSVAVYGLAVMVGVYTHYLVALAVPAQLLAAALFLRPARNVLFRTGLAALAAGLALVPWLVYAQPQFQHAGEPYWSTPFSAPGVIAELQYLLAHPGPSALVVAVAFLGVPALGILTLMAYRDSADPRRRGILYLLGCGGGSLAILFIVSLKKPLLDERFLNLYTTELLPVAGVALVWWGRRWLVGAVLLLLLGVTATEAATLPTPQTPSIAAYLNAHVDPARDVVVLYGPRQYFPLLYYSNASTRQVVRVIDRDVHWYDGLAGYRAGDLVPEVPSAPRTVYLVDNGDQAPPPLPAGVHRTARTCAPGICLETWTH